MADFVQTMKDWRRMCKMFTTDDEDCCANCPMASITKSGCGAIFENDFADVADWAELERRVMDWAAEHPEPKYPTWGEWLMEQGILVPDTTYAEMKYWCAVNHLKLSSQIPADIAEKLGIQPKEE